MALVKSGDQEVSVPRLGTEYHIQPDGKWICNYCSLSSTHKNSIKRHVEANHLLAHEYPCFSCSYKTKQKSALKKHCLSKHGMNAHHFDQLAKETFDKK